MVTHSSADDTSLGDEPVSDHEEDFVEDSSSYPVVSQSYPSLRPTFKKKPSDDTLTLPRAPCNINVNPFIRCIFEVNGREVSCLDYISEIDDPKDPYQCIKDVKYEVTLINEGLSCIDIESVTGRLAGGSPVDITPGVSVSVCPNKNFVVVHYNEHNLCDLDFERKIIVEVNGGPPEISGGFGSLT
jgi:hypothetical protein